MDYDAVFRHDVRNALASVRNAISMILEGHTNQILNDQTKMYLQNSQGQIEKVLEILSVPKENPKNSQI